MKNKQYVIRLHWNKPEQCWSVHYRNRCYLVDEVLVNIPMISKTQNRQPHAFLWGRGNVENVDRGPYSSEIVIALV